MTVAQNVEYGLRVKGGWAERRDRTAAALEMVRLSGHAGRKPAQLSGGQQQRVALARALVGRPRVLLLDEPLGALDLKLREQMQVELKAIQREVGITFVIVTHDQDEALTLCDRLAVFNNGRIEQIGAAREVWRESGQPVRRRLRRHLQRVRRCGGRDPGGARAGSVAIRPERIELLPPGQAVPAGMRSVEAVIAEVVYAGPITRVAADTATGLRLTATVLSADVATSVAHGSPPCSPGPTTRSEPCMTRHRPPARLARPDKGVRHDIHHPPPRHRAGHVRRARRRLFEPVDPGGGTASAPPKLEPLSAIGNGEAS